MDRPALHRPPALPATLVVIVGVVVAVAGLQFLLHGGQPGGYHHRVETVPPDRVDTAIERADATHDVEDLSARARDVLQRARAAPDGRVTLAGTESPPSEFQYTDDTGRYVVRTNETTLRLRTWGSSRSGLGTALVGGLLVLPVGIATALGGLLWDNSRRKRVSLLAGLVPVAVLAVLPLASVGVETAVSVGGFLLAAGVAWVAVGDRYDDSRRAA